MGFLKAFAVTFIVLLVALLIVFLIDLAAILLIDLTKTRPILGFLTCLVVVSLIVAGVFVGLS